MWLCGGAGQGRAAGVGQGRDRAGRGGGYVDWRWRGSTALGDLKRSGRDEAEAETSSICVILAPY